jgi:polyether ionophore transport system permease protein
MSQQMAGAWGLARFELRRDRMLASVWVLLLVGMCYVSATATESLYPTLSDRVAAAELVNSSPAVVALYGPILDVTSLGEVAMTKATVMYAVFVMALALVLVRRHTRAEEESGRAELLGAAQVARQAPLASAVIESGLIVTGLGALAALANIAGGLPVQGSLLFGASWWGTGLVGIGTAAVACQLVPSARTCAFIGAAAIGGLYLLRAAGDVGPSWMSWLSPLGWNTQLRAWSDPRWWVLLLYPAASVVLVSAAAALRARRDLGSGLVAVRAGPAEGSPRLRDVVALTLKLHTTSLVAWTVAAAVMGAVFGSIVTSLGSLFDSPRMQEILQSLGGTGPVADAMLAGILSVVAMVLSGFAIAVASHGGTDERDGRTEQVLATATPRGLSFLAVVAVALIGATWLMLVAGLSAGLGYGVQEGGLGDTMGRTLAGALAPAPAVWVTGSLAILCLSFGSRWASLGWAVLVLFVTVGLIGELLQLPAWVIGVSPFDHIAKVPSEPVGWGSELVLTAISLGIAALAWFSYRTRDIG